jgi:hypothetical protein
MSLRAIVRIERDTLEELKGALIAATDDAASKLGITKQRAQLARALSRIAEALEADYVEILVSARHESARLAYASLLIQGEVTDEDEPGEPDEVASRKRAEATAQSLSSAWLLVALLLMARGKTDFRKGLLSAQEYRLRRVATTETFQSYNEAYDEVATSLAGTIDYQKRWNAKLDLKTCDECSDHHGETVDLEEEFDGGDVPGAIHPNCRCVIELVPIHGKDSR